MGGPQNPQYPPQGWQGAGDQQWAQPGQPGQPWGQQPGGQYQGQPKYPNQQYQGQPQYDPQQFAQQYPNQQYPGQQYPGQFGQPGFPGQQPFAPAPGSNNTKVLLIVGGVAAVLIVAVVVALVVVRPWQSKDSVQSFVIDKGVTVELTVPAGWRAERFSDEGEAHVAVVPVDETRSYTEMDSDYKAMTDETGHPDLHGVFISADSCSSSMEDSPVGTWERDSSVDDDSQDRRKEKTWSATQRVGQDTCVEVYGTDASTSAPELEAVTIAKRLIDDDAVKPSLGASA